MWVGSPAEPPRETGTPPRRAMHRVPSGDEGPRDTEMPRRCATIYTPAVDGIGIGRGRAMVPRLPAGTFARSKCILGYWLATFGSVGMQYAFGPM